MKRVVLSTLALTLVVAACSDQSNPAQPDTEPQMAVVPVSVAAAPAISTLTITVSASDIASDLVFNVTMTNGEATDTITIPAGSDRTITVRGYDASNIETHRGSKTVNLTEGVNPQLTVVLEGLTGDQPLVVALGETTVTVSPETATVSVGGTTQLSAVVTDEAGDTLAVSVRWASTHPAVATVDDAGLVSGVSVGSASIIATYGGVGASAAVTVSDYVAFAACGDPMMDQDGNIYGTVDINGLCWFSENLTTALYTDGAPIEEIQDSVAWSSATSGAWSKLFNDRSNELLYGKLYNQSAVTDLRGICPDGWWVPSRDEQVAMVGSLGSDPVAALKATQGWDVSEGTNGTNSSGYGGLPHGAREGGSGAFHFPSGGYASWWSSTSYSATSSYVFRFPSSSGGVAHDQAGANAGHAIRCVS